MQYLYNIFMKVYYAILCAITFPLLLILEFAVIATFRSSGVVLTYEELLGRKYKPSFLKNASVVLLIIVGVIVSVSRFIGPLSPEYFSIRQPSGGSSPSAPSNSDQSNKDGSHHGKNGLLEKVKKDSVQRSDNCIFLGLNSTDQLILNIETRKRLSSAFRVAGYLVFQAPEGVGRCMLEFSISATIQMPDRYTGQPPPATGVLDFIPSNEPSRQIGLPTRTVVRIPLSSTDRPDSSNVIMLAANEFASQLSEKIPPYKP